MANNKTRVMYIEHKGDRISGSARIGRVVYSKSGQSLYYQGRRFQTLTGRGFKSNYFELDTGDHYWISGCKKLGGDRLYPGTIEIDENVREEYWLKIRKKPEDVAKKIIRCAGKHGGKAKGAK